MKINQKEKEMLEKQISKMSIGIYKTGKGKNGDRYSLKIQKNFKTESSAEIFHDSIYNAGAIYNAGNRYWVVITGHEAASILNGTLPGIDRLPEWKMEIINFIAATEGAFEDNQAEKEKAYKNIKEKFRQNGRKEKIIFEIVDDVEE
jgi:hypothetical protein